MKESWDFLGKGDIKGTTFRCPEAFYFCCTGQREQCREEEKEQESEKQERKGWMLGGRGNIPFFVTAGPKCDVKRPLKYLQKFNALK